MMALQAPVASDLRTMVSVVKIVAEIERSADLAVNICKAARRIYGHELDPRLRGMVTRMGEQAQTLYTAAIDAFVEGDAAKAAAVDDMDSLLDASTATSSRPSSRATRPGASTCRWRCSSPSWPASTSGSATTR